MQFRHIIHSPPHPRPRDLEAYVHDIVYFAIISDPIKNPKFVNPETGITLKIQ